MKRNLLSFTLVPLLLLSSCSKSLPKPELADGIRGSQLGIDKNINEDTIDKYLNRDDTVYYDMRMLKDEANYEAINGDSYLSGFIKGFKILPYPYLAPLINLPEEVGSGYQGETLYGMDEDGNYYANYKESLSIIEKYFPHDKYIMLMCGGGGYANMTKKLLIGLGYDGDKIYNTGGYWFYSGKNSIQVKKEENGTFYYDFSAVPYCKIDFSTLKVIA